MKNLTRAIAQTITSVSTASFIILSQGLLSILPAFALPANPYKVGDYYNATAYFKCSVGSATHDKDCPGGIVRKGNGQASVVVKFPNGYEVQYDFANGNVTTTFGGELDWGKSGDEWYIGIQDGNDQLFIIIPDAAIYGG